MSKEKRSKKMRTFPCCIVLIVAAALAASGCNGGTGAGKDAASSPGTEKMIQADGNVLGEGSTSFLFTVVDEKDGETQFEIHTDKETVGEALKELGLIDGDESEYGLYVISVNGISADYEKDGMYWAFYVNGKYAQAGVESTKITEGESYSFKLEKA